jgi:hypothetical protein
LKPERWGSLLVQEKYQEEKACDNNNNKIIVIIIIIIIIIPAILGQFEVLIALQSASYPFFRDSSTVDILVSDSKHNQINNTEQTVEG